MNKRVKNRGIQDINILVRDYLEKVIKKGDLVVDATGILCF